jgi:hypothetical protein
VFSQMHFIAYNCTHQNANEKDWQAGAEKRSQQMMNVCHVYCLLLLPPYCYMIWLLATAFFSPSCATSNTILTCFQVRDKPPVYWVLAQRPGDIPQGAIQIGHEADGTPLYGARAFYQGGLHIGSA